MKKSVNLSAASLIAWVSSMNLMYSRVVDSLLCKHALRTKAMAEETSLKVSNAAIISMVATNSFRTFSPSSGVPYDPEEDEPSLEPAWTHLQAGFEEEMLIIIIIIIYNSQ